jgi:mannose-6-phosphate isomerase-like protein (cupin superfamily)
VTLPAAAERFSFETVDLEPVRAHGGRTPILFCRVRRGSAGTAYNFVDLSVVPPGGEIGRHTHADDNEETYIVVSGSGRMEAGGQTFDVAPGTVVVNPPGGTHALVNPGPEELRLVVIELKVPVA